MKELRFISSTGERLFITEVINQDSQKLIDFEIYDLSVVWFTEDSNRMRVDNVEHAFGLNEVIFLTEFHQVEDVHINAARIIRFNRSFYCISRHDSEVSCRGLLFFGSSQLPHITIPEDELPIFETVYRMFLHELYTCDNLQLEMLQMMLKRFLILSTRVYKHQKQLSVLNPEQHDLIREFNFLVEQHFRTLHTVAAYSELMNKSSKTLSNLFGKFSDKTPLQLIQERLMLEARRLLRYPEKSIKEVAYDIGFPDVQSFGRFFKRMEGITPSHYREGNIASTSGNPA